MTRLTRCTASVVAACLLLGSSAQAAVIIDWVTVGNEGNIGEVQAQGTFGAVAYKYRIGKYEVTNAQYTEFLNAVDAGGTNPNGVYNTSMDTNARGGITFVSGNPSGSKYVLKSGRGGNPVVFVSFFDAMRFTNWLENGQPTGGGGTETGTYTIGTGVSETRAGGASYFIPSENEWYKAAYHKNDGVTGNYWDYPTSTDSVPYSDNPSTLNTPDDSNTANFDKNDAVANGYNDGYAVSGSPSFPSGNALTDVGAYTLAASPYGTFDQGGNVFEWNEVIISASNRGLRGGAWNDDEIFFLAGSRGSSSPAHELSDGVGFRVAMDYESELVNTGTNVTGTTGGGSGTTGGVDFDFNNVTVLGTFTAHYLTPDNASLGSVLPAGAESLINFGLPSDPNQVWNIDFTGTFTGDVSLTLNYDDTNLSVPESELGIFHYTGIEWESLTDGFLLDTVANTITFNTDSFSPFMLGAVSAVPEPSTFVLAALGLLSLGCVALRRKFRRA